MNVPALPANDVHVWRFDGERDAARAALRPLLASYLGCNAGEVRLDGAAGRKPRLAPGSGQEWLRFSVAHAGAVGLVAVARGREIGVDVERVAPERDVLTIAAQLFARTEAARLRALPPAERVATFFALWARKEAYVKATGAGLAGLEDADMSRPPRGHTLCDLDVGEGYAAALAVEGPAPRVRVIRLARALGVTQPPALTIATAC